MMHGHEKSDPAIVAVKPTNKAERSAAELVERRAGTKGNAEPTKHVPDSEPDKRVTGRWIAYGTLLPSHTRGGSRMRESRTYGSGAARLAAIPAGESPANRGVQSLL